MALVLAGCSGGWRTAGKRPPAETPARTRAQATPPRVSDRDLERRADAYAYFAAGVAHDLRNEPREAEAAHEASLKADPAHEALALDLAQRYLRNREPAKAVEVLSRASRQPHADSLIFGWLGAAYLQLTNQPAAIQAYRETIKRAPQSILGYHGLAQLYLQNGQTNEALNVLETGATQKDPSPALLVDLARFHMAAGGARHLPTELTKPRALALLDRAARLHPTEPQVLERLADGYKTLGELKRATTLYEELLRNHPPEAAAARLALRVELFQLCMRDGDIPGASRQLEGILAEHPTNSQAHLLLGAMSIEQKKYEEAERHFETAILLEPTLEPAYYDLAGVQLSLGRPQSAWETIEKARARFRAGFLMELYCGLALAAQEKYAEGLNHLAAAELHARVSEPARLNDSFYFQLGSANERAGRFEEAEAALRKCIELDPNHAEALNYLGYMWAERGMNLAEAKDFIERALKIEPDNPAFLDSLAWVLFKQGEPASALEHQVRALQLMPKPDATLLDHLGDIYAALGRPADARDAWQKSLAEEANPEVEKKLHAQPAPPAPR